MLKRLAGLAILAFACAAQAQTGKTTRLVVGFPPGQATDLVARLLAERLGPMLGENVIVENRPGQGGSGALAALAKSPADGTQLVLAPLASMVVNPHLYKNVGYDTLKDFDPVALVADLPLLMVSHPSVPAKNLPELIAYAKANPDKLTHPSAGNGTLSHLGFEDLKRRAGITILHVPYQGSPRAMADLIGGSVQVALDTVVVTQPHIQSGKMRLLATAYGQRVPAFPDTPTIAEQGFPGFSLSAWLGINVPAGTPKARIAQLEKALLAIVKAPEVSEKYVTLGAIPRTLGTDEFRAHVAAENQRWAGVVKASGAKVD